MPTAVNGVEMVEIRGETFAHRTMGGFAVMAESGLDRKLTVATICDTAAVRPKRGKGQKGVRVNANLRKKRGRRKKRIQKRLDKERPARLFQTHDHRQQANAAAALATAAIPRRTRPGRGHRFGGCTLPM